jgi:hypothetical protein
MATKTTVLDPTPRPAPGLVPVDQDPRVVEVQRRLAQAGAHAEAAEGQVKRVRAILVAADAPDRARLQAQNEIDQAERAWRTAEIDHQTIGAELGEVRALVRTELQAALTPRLRAAVGAVADALQRVRDTEHAALMDLLDEWLRLLGSGHPSASNLVAAFLTEPQPGAGTPLDTWRRFLDREIRWTDR